MSWFWSEIRFDVEPCQNRLRNLKVQPQSTKLSIYSTKYILSSPNTYNFFIKLFFAPIHSILIKQNIKIVSGLFRHISSYHCKLFLFWNFLIISEKCFWVQLLVVIHTLVQMVCQNELQEMVIKFLDIYFIL